MWSKLENGSPTAAAPYVMSVERVKRLKRYLNLINWPLLLGSLITLMILLLAVKGPDWAPHNPMQENYALRVNGKIVRPPYSPLLLPDYPLGTDQFGRDLLSRLLWGVRPTMILVGTVAATRLLLGLVLGLLIGWSKGIPEKILDTILFISLSIPVLIVALMGISAIGIHQGLWAFIFGLSVTGWAETARIVSNQTRTVKGKTYVEAAQALGASDIRIFIKHVLPQISPLVWILLAFEISATIFVTSELGFLGYYIGGGVWIEVSDFVAVNTTGLPELGQMLSTALVSLVKPMGLIVVGSFIFLAILGFNLLGEGLRLRITRQMHTGYRRSISIGGGLGSWLDEKLPSHTSDWLEANAVRLGILTLAILIVGGWSVWWNARPASAPVNSLQGVNIPGGHFWATERRDAQGTRWVPYEGPKNSIVDWTFSAEGGFIGGPVVSAKGNIYVTTGDQRLVSLSPSGSVLWQAELNESAVGTPALGSGGEIYVTDVMGGLSSLSPDGSLQWRFAPESGWEATSGPIVSSDGVIYYTRVETIQAVSPQGYSLWQAIANDGYVEKPPILSPGESYIFLLDGALAASSGAKLALDGLPVEELKFTLPVFFVGGNEKTYLRTGDQVYGWWVGEEGVQVDPVITWENAGQAVLPPYDQGATPQDRVWLFYAGEYIDTRLVWLDKNSKLLANIRPADRQSKLIAVDRNSISYICSENFNVGVNCKALSMDSTTPVWLLELGDFMKIAGAALAPGRLYISTDTGTLYAVGSGVEGDAASNTTNVDDSAAQTNATLSNTITATVMDQPSATASLTATPDQKLIITTPTNDISSGRPSGAFLYLPVIYR